MTLVDQLRDLIHYARGHAAIVSVPISVAAVATRLVAKSRIVVVRRICIDRIWTRARNAFLSRSLDGCFYHASLGLGVCSNQANIIPLMLRRLKSSRRKR